MRHLSMFAMAVALLAGSPAFAQGKLVMRHGEQAPAGPIAGVGLQGVLVGEQGRAVLVPWASVLRIEGREVEPQFAEIADLAWRAPLRLGRGDAVTSEPMFERLLILLGEDEGPTAQSALAGLMRCQLSRDARDLAVVTWSRWVDASGATTEQNVYRPSQQFSDHSGRGAASGLERGPLRVEFAPFWPTSNEPSLLASSETPAGDSVGRLLLAWYRSAARLATDMAPEFPDTSSQDPTVLLVRDLVLAQSGQRELARSARGRLLERLADTPANDWISAWIHTAIGHSLVSEREETQRQLGVVHLLHVPAQWSAVTPDLARLCLAQAAATLESMGDDRGSDALLAELRRHQLASYSSQEPLP